MKTYNYYDVTFELVSRGIVAPTQVFDFRHHPLIHSYHRMFQFAQTNLSEVCLADNYNIEPSRFYYPNFSDVNACARYQNGYYIIEINRGTFEQLYGLFCHNNDIIDDPELVVYQQLNEILEAEPHEVSLCYLMYQTATLFTYYHELGHLIQFSNRINGFSAPLPLAPIEEQYAALAPGSFSLIDHITEYDADLHGANSTAFHILDMWNRMKNEQTEENLSKLTVSSLVSIMGYIILLWGNFESDVYYNENTHPHPLIRISWILTVIVDRIKAYWPSIDQHAITSEVLRVLNVYFKHLDQDNIQNQFLHPLMQNYSQIMEYISHIMSEARAVPFLASNTVHVRNL